MYLDKTPNRNHLPWSGATPENALFASSGGGGCDGDGGCGDGQSGSVGCGH